MVPTTSSTAQQFRQLSTRFFAGLPSTGPPLGASGHPPVPSMRPIMPEEPARPGEATVANPSRSGHPTASPPHRTPTPPHIAARAWARDWPAGAAGCNVPAGAVRVRAG
jgi:hypothetical protein